jgi:hypothetical protein
MKQRDDDFGARRGIASDVSGELVDIRNDNGFAALSGGPADTAAQRDSDAGDFALEGAEHQIMAAKKVEPDPVYSGQCLEKQCGQIGGIGQTVAFIGEQGRELLVQLAIGSGFGETCARGNNVHVKNWDGEESDDVEVIPTADDSII